MMHKYHYGYLGRDVWAAYCPCGWTHKQKIDADTKRELFVAFIEHLESTAEEDRDVEVL